MPNLFTHQITGADYLATRAHAYLGDVPGAGKTRTILEALRRTMSASQRVVVACPAIAKSHWVNEAAVIGLASSLQVESYDYLVRQGHGGAWYRHVAGADVLVLDEAHYLKHAGAQRTKLLLGKNGYARHIPRVIAASGTPVPRNPLEYGTILLALFPDIAAAHGVRTLADLRNTFVVMRKFQIRGRWIEKPIGSKNDAEFKEILQQTMLRRTLDQLGVDVPRLFWQVVPLDVPGKVPDADVIEEPCRNALSWGERLGDPAVARYRRRVGEAKAAAAVEMLAHDLEAGDEKIVVFAHHRRVLDLLQQGLRYFGVVRVDGSTTQIQRDTAVEHFQTSPTIRVFLGQNIACQASLTLTAARRVVLVEPDWTAYVNLQLAKRIARIGQTGTRCVAQMLTLAGTLDDWIIRQNAREVQTLTKLDLGDA